jgi:hypothetical protein
MSKKTRQIVDTELKLARDVLARLTTLRARIAPLSALAALAFAIHPPAVQAQSLRNPAFMARNASWIAVCRLRDACSEQPLPDNMPVLWDDVIGRAESWLKTMESER